MSTGSNLLRYLPKNFDFSTIDFNDKSDERRTIYAVNAVCLTLSTLFVCLRLYSRLLVVRKVGLDDVLIIIALIFASSLSAMVICTARYYGLGRHIWTLPLGSISLTAQTLTKMLYVIAILYTATISTIKYSILSFYLLNLSPPSFSGQHSLFRILTISLMVLVGLLFFISTFITIFQCRPVNAAWNFTIPNRKCIEIQHFYYAQAGLNLFGDIAIYVLPMPMLWKMLLPVRQRILICGVMGIGAFVCVAGILRLYYLVKDVGESINLTWVMINVANYSILEAHIGIFCASIPSLKPLIVRTFPRLLGSTRNMSFSASPGPQPHQRNNNNNNIHHRSESWMKQGMSPGESIVDPRVPPLRIPTAEDLERAAKGGPRDPDDSILNSPPPVDVLDLEIGVSGRKPRIFSRFGRRLSSGQWLRGGSVSHTSKDLRLSIPKQLRVLGVRQSDFGVKELRNYSMTPDPTVPPPIIAADLAKEGSSTGSISWRKLKNSNTPFGGIGPRNEGEEMHITSPTSPLSPASRSYTVSPSVTSPVYPSSASRVQAAFPLPTFNLVSGAIVSGSATGVDIDDDVPDTHPYSHVYTGTSNTSSATGSGEGISSTAANIASIRSPEEQEKAFRQVLLAASRVPEISEESLVSLDQDSSKEKEHGSISP